MKILAAKRLSAAEDMIETDSVVDAANRKYKKKRMNELSDSSLNKIAKDQQDPRRAMAERELKRRRAQAKRQGKTNSPSSKKSGAKKPLPKIM